MYPFLILTFQLTILIQFFKSFFWILFIKPLFFFLEQYAFRAIDFWLSFFEQFNVEQLIFKNLPDTLWPVFDHNNEHHLKPSQMC